MTDRFKEIVSTQKIVDTWTGIEHDGLVDDELITTINELHKSCERHKKIRKDQEKEIDLLITAVNGLLAVNVLRQKGWIYDDDWVE